MSKSHVIPEIRSLKRCKTASLSRVSRRAEVPLLRRESGAVVPVLRRDSDSLSYIVFSNRILGIRCLNHLSNGPTVPAALYLIASGTNVTEEP